MKAQLDPSSRTLPKDPVNAPQPMAPTAPPAPDAPATATPAPSDRYGAAAKRPAGDLDGAPRAETAALAKCPFSGSERAELSKKIPCPALAGLFNAGMLPADKDGTVKLPDLDHALNEVGLSRSLRETLKHGADKTDPVAGSFNLFKLNGSSLDHTGSSGIRQNGVHPERFELMRTFSKDGHRLTSSDLADAARQFAKESPGFKGGVTQLMEMAVLLETFGQRDSHGHPFFTIDEAKALWVDGQLPKSWSLPAVPGTVGTLDVLKLAAMMKLDQFF